MSVLVVLLLAKSRGSPRLLDSTIGCLGLGECVLDVNDMSVRFGEEQRVLEDLVVRG
jgi:hypothetical protein